MIKGERLVLDIIKNKDQLEMVSLFKNNEIKETYMIPDYDSDDKYLNLFNKFVQLSEDKNRFVRGIYLNNLLIGFLNDVEVINKSVELGYVINPLFKNNGYMTEALKLAINYLLNNGFDEVICGAFYFNNASMRVMQKAGMILLERTDYVTYKNKEIKCIYYSIKK